MVYSMLHASAYGANMLRQVFLFTVAGAIGLIVDMAVLYAAVALLGPFYGRALSFLAAVLTTWLVNRSFAFRGRRSGMSLKREFLAYLSLMVLGGAVNFAVYSVLVVRVSVVAQHLFLGVAAGSLAGMVVNFASSRFLLFRRA